MALTLVKRAAHLSLAAASLAASIWLSACGGGETPAAPTSVQEPTAQLAPTIQEPTTPAPTSTSVGETTQPVLPTTELAAGEALPPAPEALAAVRELVLARTQDEAMLDATLYEIASYAVPGARGMLFHWEDRYGEAVVACTGYAIISDGTNEIQTISAGCGPVPAPNPITVYPGRGFDAAGAEVMVVFGEIYDSAVASIRAAVAGAEYEARIAGSGYLVELPAQMEVLVTAYDLGGTVLYSGSPSVQQ